MNSVQYIIDISTRIITNGGLLVGFFLVFLESFIPILPLSVFVALNVNSFGFFEGVLISWIATSIGSIICYHYFYLVDESILSYLYRYRPLKRISVFIDKFYDINFTKLVLLETIPFTPSFFINVLSGISKMSLEKYLLSILIGKCFSIIFWGYIGKSIIESLTNINSLIYISITLLLAYLLSRIINYYLEIK